MLIGLILVFECPDEVDDVDKGNLIMMTLCSDLMISRVYISYYPIIRGDYGRRRNHR